MDTHPLDHPLMREAQRHRELADKIDELRSELAPRPHFEAVEPPGREPGRKLLTLSISADAAERLRRGESITIGGSDCVTVSTP